jgi:hypothetical protein
MAVGFFAPSVQIGALTDVAETDFGAASGAVETSRELGGAVVIAAASSVLLGSHTGLLHGMHSGYVVIAIGGGIGLLATLLPLKPRRIPVSGYAAAAPAPQRTAS